MSLPLGYLPKEVLNTPAKTHYWLQLFPFFQTHVALLVSSPYVAFLSSVRPCILNYPLHAVKLSLAFVRQRFHDEQ